MLGVVSCRLRGPELGVGHQRDAGHQDAMDVGEFPGGAAEFLPFHQPRTGVAGVPGVSSLLWGRLGLGVSHSGFPSWQGTGGPAAPTSVCSFQLLFPFPCTVFRQKGHVCFATYSPSRKLYALPAWACGRIHDSDSVFRIVLELLSLISQCHQKRMRESGQSESKATVI